MADGGETCADYSHDSDFFAGLFANRISKFLAVTFSALGGAILMPLIYGIIWYEKYGSDQKRTLINKLVSSLCWSCIQWFLIIQMLDMFRYVYGPLPPTLCQTELHFRFVVFTQQILFLDGIIIVRYVYIFWLKNVAAFNDDFWYMIINIWIVGFSIISQAITFCMPGRNTLYYYICTGKDPLDDEHIAPKTGFTQQIVTVLSIFLHIFVLIKILLYKRKVEPKPVSLGMFRNTFSIKSIFNNSLSDLTTCISITILCSVVVIFTLKANEIPIKDFNCYPNYLFEYFFRMIWPIVFGYFLVCLFYYRNPNLRVTLMNELKNTFTQMYPIRF